MVSSTIARAVQSVTPPADDEINLDSMKMLLS